MKIIVAGGAGFLGSWLCEDLLKNRNQVVCIDNFISGNKKNIDSILRNPGFTFINHDLIKPLSGINYDFSKTEAIYHLASPASPNVKSKISYMAHPVETLLVNSAGTYNLLELAKTTGAKFLFASSSEVYGEPKVHPQTEDYIGNVNPNGPRSCYDEAKRFGEAMTFSYIRKYGIDARVVRIFNTYGPKMDPDDGRVISNFVVSYLLGQPLTVYGKGTQTRSFCYVSDLIEGIKSAMDNNKTKGEVINLGNDHEFTILDLIKTLEKVTGKKLKITFNQLPQDDPTRRNPDLKKAGKLLGYKPKVGLEEGLEKTIKYFKTVIL